MKKNLTYEEFVGKFQLKFTADDCMTPPGVYEVAAAFVAAEYGVFRSFFVRQFFRGGDCMGRDYPEGRVVVDAPQFSILSKNVWHYNDAGVRSVVAYWIANGAKVIFCDFELRSEEGGTSDTSAAAWTGSLRVEPGRGLVALIVFCLARRRVLGRSWQCRGVSSQRCVFPWRI